MNLRTIDDEINSFIGRVVETLKLYKCEEGMLANQKRLFTWVRQEHQKLKKKKDEQQKKKPGMVGHLVGKILKGDQDQQVNPFETDLTTLSECIKKGIIPKSFRFHSQTDIPQEIINLVQQMKGKKFQNYYGFVKGPFMNDYFIRKKENFHSIIESVEMNQLKFLMIQENVAHLYQRNLVQEIFGRIFRQKGALSLVMNIEVNFDPLEPPYNIFCYIQDRKLQSEIQWKPIQDLIAIQDELFIKVEDKNIPISDLNILKIFLSQILVLPLQTLVSDFIVQTTPTVGKLIKCNQQSQQQIIKQKSLREHPSLRNPLFFFKTFLETHCINISEVRAINNNNYLYSSFYKCLQIVISLLQTDFEVSSISSSLLFNDHVLEALWITLHKIGMMEGWLNEVINPVKNHITISEIVQHFCPVFNEISGQPLQNFQQYCQFFQNVLMESYLINRTSRGTLEKYKDMYVSVSRSTINKKLSSWKQIYSQIFSGVLQEANLMYTQGIETACILNFYFKYRNEFWIQKQKIQEKWKNHTIWEKAIKALEKQTIHFVGVGFDIFAYLCGVDSYNIDQNSFERIRNSEESQSFLKAIRNFVDQIKINWEDSSSEILSSLLQKSFKHKKFKVCRVLLEKNVQIKDFKEIIKSERHQVDLDEQTKNSIIQAIKISSPRMHRLYKWQQLMVISLKNKDVQYESVETFEFGTVYLPKSTIQLIDEKGKVVNNLSRKDYRFNSSKQRAHIDLGNDRSFYLESVQFPLLSYFYRIVFEELGCQQIMFNFASFFRKGKIYHIFESLPRAMNFKKGLLNFTENQLFAMSNIETISEAIVLSMILLPMNLTLSDIIISPSDESNGQIFVLDWHSFYSKNFMSKCQGKIVLNTKNILFASEIMHKAVDQSIIKKYSSLDPMKVCQNIFIKCKQFSEKIHSFNKEQNEFKSKQHLAMIFQSGFIFNLAERMLKIKRCFNQNSSVFEKGLSFYKVLEYLNSQTSYFYQQIYNTSISVRDREKALLNDNWRRSFLHNSMIEFFGGFRRLEQTESIFPTHYYKFCFQGPTESLADVVTYIKKFKAFNKENPDFYSSYSNEYFEYIMKNIDLSTYTREERLKFMQLIKNKSLQHLQNSDKKMLPLSFIKLNSVEFLKNFYLNNFSFERVQELILENCKIGEYDINGFPNTLGNVIYLQLKDIQGVKYIGGNTLSGSPVEIKHLKILSIIDCNQLLSIDLKCDILECLELRNNENLKSIFIFSLNLKNIYISNNQQISLENIGVYILKGINILLCKNSCKGELSKLHQSYYESFLSNILKQLLISLFNRQKRYMIMLTMLKMKQINQNTFAKAGLSSFQPFATLFNRFNKDSQDCLMEEIYKLYFSNPHLKEIVIGKNLIEASNLIPKVNIERLFNIISRAITQTTFSKHFVALRFQNSHEIFTNLHKLCIETFMNRIQTQKYFSLILDKLQISPKINTNEKQIQLVRFLGTEKLSIQKMTLILRNSFISIDFLTQNFHNTVTLDELKEKSLSKGQNLQFPGINLMPLDDQFSNHMKINRITLQECQVQDFPKQIFQMSKNPLNNFLQKQVKEQFQTDQINIRRFESLELEIEEQQKRPYQKANTMEIKVQVQNFRSVKQLKINKCKLQSFELLRFLPNLKLIRISECFLGNQDDILKSKIKDLFYYVNEFKIQTLDLQGFFTNTRFYTQMFQQFCQTLKNNKNLKVLKLNKSSLTFFCLQKLDEILNDTYIEQLELDDLSITQRTANYQVSYIHQKAQLFSHRQLQKQKRNAKHLQNFLKDTKHLKSLRIYFSSLQYLKSFLHSIGSNKSLIHLHLNTDNEIPSSYLSPLSENTILQKVSSSQQLPMWLLQHINQSQKPSPQQESIDTSLMNALDWPSRNICDYYRLGLSLDGGGMRGMLLATELDYIASNVGYPLHKIFDCIGGTSIGGILALLSTGTLDGRNPVASSSELKDLFAKYGKDIFKKSTLRQFRNLIDTKYSPDSFETVLKNYFKDCKLSNCLEQTSTIITAVNRIDNKDYIFRSKQAVLNREKDFYMRDVARATSAAPTYFPSAQIKNVNATVKLSMLDGGVGMNNPSKLVIDEVMKISANSSNADNYFLLSLGTGRLPSETIPESAGLKDISPIIDSFSESSNSFLQRGNQFPNSDLSINFKGHFYRVSPSINISNKKNGQLDNTSDQIIKTYEDTGLESSKKFFKNTIIFGKYRNMNLIEWLRENTNRKYQF